ncbi:trichohyalin-like isoform X2 [Prinia subflava]|uniref:trichohyalin-like isoform X2 n=1 Tax=Prinia subflava TaxID=208062 RepID=UPI002FE167A3
MKRSNKLKVSSTPISHVQCCHTANKDSCSSLLPRCPVTHCAVCAWSPAPCCTSLIPPAKRNFTGPSSEASRVLRGARVLARREADGCYYLGHVVQEGSREGFLIEFDQSCAPKGKVQLGRQETPLYDLVHYEDARRQPLAPGDRVLAPWEAAAKRFGPGTVLRVVENTEAPLGTAHKERRVLVNFWNGQTKEVPSVQALRIPLALSERIILELQMPLAARQMVVDSSLDYPYLVAPGYRASGHCRQAHVELGCCPGALYCPHPCAECSWGCTSPPQGCLAAWDPTRPAECRVQQENAFIPGASLTEDKLSKKIEQELSELRIASSESVSREEEKTEEKILETDNILKDVRSCLEEDREVIETEKGPQREMARAVVDAAVNTDSWLMETDHKEEAESRQQDAETEANFAHEHDLSERRVAGVPVQHSHRSPALGRSALVPFRHQSFFAQVHQALEKDSLSIRSALGVQRAHSPTNPARSTHLPNLLKDKSITKSVLSGASQERWKELDFNRAKIEHKRWQEEQRQLKRKQQQEAEGTRRQQHRDSQRQRLHQRTLQELEKQLEHKERALQHVALLQAAGAERSRKESSFREEEERKAKQRLQFLKTQRLRREELQAESNKRSCEQEKERLELLRSRVQSRQEVLEQESQWQDKQQNQHQAAKVRMFQRRESSRLKMEKEGQRLRALQQYLREQNLLLLRASLLA